MAGAYDLRGVSTSDTVSSVFERYSDRAREVVVFAQEEARALGHPFISAEHLLLGVVRVRAGGALMLEEVQDAVAAAFGRSYAPVDGQIPFTADAQTALERAVAIARRRTVQPRPPAPRATRRPAWVREFGGE